MTGEAEAADETAVNHRHALIGRIIGTVLVGAVAAIVQFYLYGPVFAAVGTLIVVLVLANTPLHTELNEPDEDEERRAES